MPPKHIKLHKPGENPEVKKIIEPKVIDNEFELNYFYNNNRQGNCETNNGKNGNIRFDSNNNSMKIYLEYIDYGAFIRFPNGEVYSNRCFILSLAHVLKIDVCEFYGNILKTLYSHIVPPEYENIVELRNMNIEELNKYAGEYTNGREMRDNAGELAMYKTEKQKIMSTGRGVRDDYIDGSLLLKYFNFSDLLPNGLIILIKSMRQKLIMKFDMK